MPYEARVKDKVVPKTVRFSGDFEFVRYEWRSLPDDKLELARNNPYLEVRIAEGPVEPVPSGVVVEDIEEGEVNQWLQVDDLTEIKGVGASTAAFLANYGYNSFASLAEEDPDRLQTRLSEAKYPINKLDAGDLIRQAKDLL